MERFLPGPAGIKPVRYRFADLRLEADGKLLRGEAVLALGAAELNMLRALLERQGEVVSATELSRALGCDAQSRRDGLAKSFASLKKTLRPTDCIESVYRRGYRISAQVESVEVVLQNALPVLAILPFSTGFEVPEYLGLALAEQTMEQMGRARPAPALIAARDSVCVLAKRDLSPQQLGKMLHADLVLTGQLLATSGRHRVRAEMFRAEDGKALWMEDLIAARDQIAELVRELVNRVASRLSCGQIQLSAEAEAFAGNKTSPAQREARDLWLRAHYEWQSQERHRMQDALGRLLRAVELDPALMEARTELAHLAIAQCFCGYLSPSIAVGAVRRATERISQLNDQAEVLLPALAWAEFHYDRDAESALRLLARTEGLPYDPAHARIRVWILLSRQWFGEAIELLRMVQETDPWSPWPHAWLAWALHLAGERDASVAQALKGLETFPDFDNSLFFAAIILAYNGEAGRAVEIAKSLTERSSHYDLAVSAHAYALACAGRTEESHELLEQLEWLGHERFVLKTLNAATYVALGEPAAALAELRMVNQNRCPWFFHTMADPRLLPLRQQPEFAALAAALSLRGANATDLR